MRIERRLDTRMFDELLPVHTEVDQLQATNKKIIYISGNVNVDLYNKNTCGNLAKIIGGEYIFDKSPDKKKVSDGNSNDKSKALLLGSGKSSVVYSTIFGPVVSGHGLATDREYSRVNVKIKNSQGNRSDREKMFEEIVTRHLEKVINFHLYKYHQFHFKIQIVEECTYILSSIFNAIFLNLIHSGISMNYSFCAINVGIVDPNKYMNFFKDRYASSASYTNNTEECIRKDKSLFDAAYDKYKSRLFHKCGEDIYIPTVILDPLQEEIDLYCNSAFTYIVAPNYNHILGNIMIISSTGLSKETSVVSDTYALQASNYIFKCISEAYKKMMRQTVTKYMEANRINE